MSDASDRTGLRPPGRSATTTAIDVVIVGGGPAGIAGALALHAQGLRVVVAERRMRGTRGSPAETLPGRVRPLLDALGAGDLLDDRACAPIHAHSERWGPVVRERNPRLDPHGPGWQVDRDRFDELLRARALDLGLDVRLGMRCSSIVPEAGGWRIRLDQDRGQSSLRAAFVVDASGRSAFVARRLGARRRRCDRSVAMIAGILGPTEHRGATLVEVCPTGWWHASSLASEDVALTFVSDASLLPRGAAARANAFLDHLRTAPLVERYLTGCGAPAWLRVVSAAPAATTPMAGDGWLAIGDAAAAYDPLAFSGVTQAIEHGQRSAEAIAAWLGGDRGALERYRARTEAEFAAHLETRRTTYALAGMSRFAFWGNRATPTPVPAPASTHPPPPTAWRATEPRAV